MRAYSASEEEVIRARDLLKDWAGEGFLTEAQYKQMEQETICDLRRTNIFLRIVLFLFTLLIVGAAVALFFVVFFSQPAPRTVGIFLIIFAAVSYAATELAISHARLYRFGIEEGLAVCSVGFLCVGMQAVLFGDRAFLATPGGMQSLVPTVGAIVSLWIWHRLGLRYAFPAVMIFVAWLATYWTSSHPGQHMLVAGFYVAGLISVAAVRPGYRFTYLNDRYSVAEALLWLGIYLAINLQLSSPDLLALLWSAPRTATEFSRPFYWGTWVLTWYLPPIVLVRGVRLKDRFVIGAGGIVAILTLVTNKPYIGWPRHTWDPMLMGVLLIGVALFIRRWLAKGPGEIRHGFTAQRLSRGRTSVG